MDMRALVVSGIKHKIKSDYFEALSQGIGETEFRKIVNEALEELEDKKPEGPKVVPNAIQVPSPGPFEGPRTMTREKDELPEDPKRHGPTT